MAVQIDMVGLIVKDMAASLRFYRMLGLDIPDGKDGEDYVDVITPNGYRISWNTEKMMSTIDPAWSPTSGSRIGLAFKCDNPAEVDATFQRLVDAGYQGYKEPWDAFWGQRYAQIVDPDGNHTDIFAAL